MLTLGTAAPRAFDAVAEADFPFGLGAFVDVDLPRPDVAGLGADLVDRSEGVFAARLAVDGAADLGDLAVEPLLFALTFPLDGAFTEVWDAALGGRWLLLPPALFAELFDDALTTASPGAAG
ncbi:MAG: hypothetical protein H6726_15035 [Sandaracinaceae bacterium]|nr:hypothetical protein [Sandaracinaceae bacterium]